MTSCSPFILVNQTWLLSVLKKSGYPGQFQQDLYRDLQQVLSRRPNETNKIETLISFLDPVHVLLISLQRPFPSVFQ